METWTDNMKHFLTITNVHKDQGGRLTEAIAAYIRQKGGVMHLLLE